MNTSRLLVLSLGLLMLFPATGHAFRYHPGHNFGLAYRVADFSYEEPGMREDGLLHGVSAEYVLQNEARYLTRFFLAYLGGEVDYDGETWGGTPAETSGRDHILDGRVTVGRAFSRDGLTWCPFLGFGTRYWKDDQDSTEVLATYERETLYYYSPLGAMLDLDLDGSWSTGITAQYKLLWGGSVTSRFSDIDSQNDDITVDYGFLDGYGLEASLHLTYSSPPYSFTVSPYVASWDLDRSEYQEVLINGNPGRLFEPANETTIFGLALSVGF